MAQRTQLSHGLVTSDGVPVPLKEISVKCGVQGCIADIQTQLLYYNDEDQPIQAKFTFPVDDSSAVYKFEAVVEGRLIVGECQDKDQARQTYDDAIAAGHSAFLLQESDAAADVFECDVGNLPPHTSAQITFAYVIELGTDAKSGAARLVYPVVLGQRYQPTVLQNTDGASTSKARGTKRPPKFREVSKHSLPYTFTFRAEVKGSHKIIKVEAEDNDDDVILTYPAKGNKTHAVVELADDFRFDHDVILLMHYATPFKPHAIIEYGVGKEDDWFMNSNMVLLNYVPQLHGVKGVTGRGEYIFIVDRSGSMGGARIQSAANALGEFLKILPKDCYFNIISFGSHYRALFDASASNQTKTAMTKAVKLKNSLQADFGGTEMIQPFQFVYSKPTLPNHPRQIFLLTDGGIWSPQVLIDLVKKHQNNSRVFTFGIGSGASTSLMKGVARAGKGKAEFISDDLKGLAAKVKSTLQSAMQPHVTNVSLTYTPAGDTSPAPDDVTITTLPSDIPPIFMGERLSIYALVKSTGDEKKILDKPMSLTLRGDLEDTTFTHHLPFTLRGGSRERKSREAAEGTTEGTAVGPIHRLAAKVKIKELEDGEDTAEKNKAEIVLLSQSANLVSRYTAFVGVDKGRVEKVTGDLLTRDVPRPEREAERKRKKKKVPTATLR